MLRRVATIEAMCTKGPSLPSGNPEPKVKVSPTIFAISVRKVRYSLRTTPRKMVFISGIPEPIAYDSSAKAVSVDARVERTRFVYSTYGW